MSFSLLVLLCLLYGNSLGAPPPTEHLYDFAQSNRGSKGIYGHKNRKFSVKQVLNPNFSPSALSCGPSALRSSYLKHNIYIPPAVAKSPSLIPVPPPPSLKGSVVSNPSPSNYDREYLIPVTIGAVNPQVLNLDLDTGSSELWVFSNQTKASEVTNQIVYRPDTCTGTGCAKLEPNEKWAVFYSDQSSSSGVVYNDTVTIGGVTVPGQAVEAALLVSASFTADTSRSGLIGFGFGSINTCRPTPCVTWFDNIKASLAANVWTANLKKGTPGTYNFGYIDSTAYTGSIGYTPVNNARGFWEFTSSGYAIGSSTFVNTNMDAIADTGTTLLLLPAAVVAAYWAQVKGAAFSATYGAYLYPCSITPPNFTFGIGSYRGVIPGRYMDYGAVNSTQCYGGIQSQGGSSFSVFGDILLKAQFVVFDVGNLQIGFAAKPLT